MPQSDSLPHVVIVGGGFAGLAVVQSLKRANVRITLIDRRVYNTFQPLLYQVATGGLNPGNVTYFLRGLRLKQKNVRVLHEHLMSIDAAGRTVRLHNGQDISYDYLVVASGVTTNFFGTPGAKEHAFPMYSRSQALRIRDELFVRLEQAAAQSAKHRGLHVTIVGGGPTGIEVAGALAELRDAGLRPAYPEISGDAFDVTIIQRGDELLKTFAPSLRKYTAQQLEKRGVTLAMGRGVAEVHADHVVLSDGATMRSDLTVWSTGVAPHQEVDDWNLPRGKSGRIRVGDDLLVEGHSRIFAAGDIAVSPAELPQLAQPAIQSGKQIARNILALIAGKPTSPLRYFDKGTMAVIGRRAAITQVFDKFLIKGPIAWVAWLFVHIMGLVGPRNRITTFTGLITRYGFPLHQHPIPIVGDVPTVRPGNRSTPKPPE